VPRDTRFPIETVDVETDAVTALLAGGYLQMFTNPRPDTGNDPPTGATLVAELRFASPAFGPSVAGVATALPMDNTTTVAEGRVTWFRATRIDGTPVFDGNVGTTDENIVLANTLLAFGALVSVASFQYRSPRT
jgi:hypothetical protein